MDAQESLIQRLRSPNSTQDTLVEIISRYLTPDEAVPIIQQFLSDDWLTNGQVLWSGVPRNVAQQWAEDHQMQTLTTAMGPLMRKECTQCRRKEISAQKWSKYIHGASAVFAWRIAQDQTVTLLSPPPPGRFHPTGLSFFQVIEEPIIKTRSGQNALCRIMMVHPTVKGAADFPYEIWPNDESFLWIERFGMQPGPRKWRQTKQTDGIPHSQSAEATSIQPSGLAAESRLLEDRQLIFVDLFAPIFKALIILCALKVIPVLTLGILICRLLSVVHLDLQVPYEGPSCTVNLQFQQKLSIWSCELKFLGYILLDIVDAEDQSPCWNQAADLATVVDALRHACSRSDGILRKALSKRGLTYFAESLKKLRQIHNATGHYRYYDELQMMALREIKKELSSQLQSVIWILAPKVDKHQTSRIEKIFVDGEPLLRQRQRIIYELASERCHTG
ncbi:uncharacterized protein N7446_004000 [Penicillium canescens]|uniref:Uncharacterized protein n=1 Tax=Penicillium canescens TaxID=5083 RepID=A0AAD6I3C1_PENCN|nr:uncharacterized protein N7446_004000 [Penicillium canescens]KAJ6027405.1 hypothetical protein N7460_012222 [Penicillium canescens]KAJ6040683.1 hypothetical protein N7444_009588 [Penicillium canescens]KAJ6066963.1 hypothetical protein N7446_004000 [Penicillium canescens]